MKFCQTFKRLILRHALLMTLLSSVLSRTSRLKTRTKSTSVEKTWKGKRLNGKIKYGKTQERDKWQRGSCRAVANNISIDFPLSVRLRREVSLSVLIALISPPLHLPLSCHHCYQHNRIPNAEVLSALSAPNVKYKLCRVRLQRWCYIHFNLCSSDFKVWTYA